MNESGETIVSTDSSNTTAANADPDLNVWPSGNLESGAWITSNSRSEIPREYISNTVGQGFYYSWYSAIAESGGWSTRTIANDSVCPNGWSVPAKNGKTWPTLLANEGSSFQVSRAATSMSLMESGYYNLIIGQPGYVKARVFYWAGEGSPDNNYTARVITGLHGGNITYTTGHKTDGIPIRCVKL